MEKGENEKRRKEFFHRRSAKQLTYEQLGGLAIHPFNQNLKRE
jgi:hypothetical protein